MKKVHYNVTINAPAEKVFNTMLEKKSYEQWTAAFNPTSTYEGSWGKGDKIYFIGEHEGKKGGMVARIAENIPNKFVSIEHYGILEDGKEITEGPAVEAFAGTHENYSFEPKGGGTLLSIEVDTVEQYADYFDQTWPVALAKLKEIAEA
ncbi:MAG: SRPBCC domain-containing protein [Chitinophagaceae bacterium]|nr:SRPBCC domain-containing protein [Chitinophagaceae bacterium]